MGMELPSLSFKLGIGVLMLAIVENGCECVATAVFGGLEALDVQWGVVREGRIRGMVEVELRFVE